MLLTGQGIYQSAHATIVTLHAHEERRLTSAQFPGVTIGAEGRWDDTAIPTTQS
jgi:hypothetical protein